MEMLNFNLAFHTCHGLCSSVNDTSAMFVLRINPLRIELVGLTKLLLKCFQVEQIRRKFNVIIILLRLLR